MQTFSCDHVTSYVPLWLGDMTVYTGRNFSTVGAIPQCLCCRYRLWSKSGMDSRMSVSRYRMVWLFLTICYLNLQNNTVSWCIQFLLKHFGYIAPPLLYPAIRLACGAGAIDGGKQHITTYIRGTVTAENKIKKYIKNTPYLQFLPILCVIVWTDSWNLNCVIIHYVVRKMAFSCSTCEHL